MFTSASTVRGFAAMAEGLDLTSVRAACIGPQTGAAAGPLGMEVHTAERATIDSLIQLVKQMHKRSVKHGSDSETPPPAGQ